MRSPATVRICEGILLAAFSAAAAGCFFRRLEPRDARFFDLPLMAGIDSLPTYPLQDQVEIYLVGLSRRRPPARYLADPLASNGPALIPYVLPYLRRRMHGGAHADLLYVFEVMACRRGVHLASETELLVVARAAMQDAHDDYWKGKMRRSLTAIEGDCGTRHRVRVPDRAPGV